MGTNQSVLHIVDDDPVMDYLIKRFLVDYADEYHEDCEDIIFHQMLDEEANPQRKKRGKYNMEPVLLGLDGKKLLPHQTS